MASSTLLTDYFAFLCLREKQSRYHEQLRLSPLPIRFTSDVGSLLRHCLENPPRAMLLDVCTCARLGARAVAPLFELRVAWPVLRSNVLANGAANVMCTTPQCSAPLLQALAEIAADSPRWQHPRHRRRHLRINVNCRVRVREKASRTWEMGNTLDVSSGGAFVVCYQSPRCGTRVEVELHDLNESPIHLEGKVAWSRGWEDSSNLPGMALDFNDRGASQTFRDAITHPRMLAALQGQLPRFEPAMA